MITPFYDDGQVTIWCADLRTVDLREAAACVVTSPPYNLGVDYDGYADALAWPEYAEFSAQACRRMAAALVEGGRCWLNTVAVAGPPGTPRQGRQALLRQWWQAVEAAGLSVVDLVGWRAPMRAGSLGTSWGSWQSPASPNLRGDWETVLVACRRQWARRPPPGMQGWRDRLGHWEKLTQNCWEIPTGGAHDIASHHPAPFPVELARRCIRLSTWPGETVLDPFAGSGTTLLAARQLGRRAVGVERSERYCEQAVSRLAQTTFDFSGAA